MPLRKVNTEENNASKDVIFTDKIDLFSFYLNSANCDHPSSFSRLFNKLSSFPEQ